MRKLLFAALLLPMTTGAAEAPMTLNIDAERITVSGISSGAHMAHQLHISYSDIFSGAALLSGGPFGCADDSLLTAMSRCMEKTEDPIPIAELLAEIDAAEKQGKVADTANLANDRVWMFHGTKDTTIAEQVHDSTVEIYAAYMPLDQVMRVNDVPAGHFFPAKGSGHGCEEMVAPFVGDCDFDAAGQLLSYLYPGLDSPGDENLGELQAVELPGADDADLLEQAYLYVPEGCRDGSQACALHLVLHGCAQSAETVGTGFIEQSGYLPWAEANGIVLAFPQVAKSLVAPINPYGCWDWWGYACGEYLWRDGEQMSVLTDWLKNL